MKNLLTRDCSHVNEEGNSTLFFVELEDMGKRRKKYQHHKNGLEEPMQSIIDHIPWFHCNQRSKKNQRRLMRLTEGLEHQGSVKSRRSSHCIQCVSQGIVRSHPIQGGDQLPMKPQKIHSLAIYGAHIDNCTHIKPERDWEVILDKKEQSKAWIMDSSTFLGGLCLLEASKCSRLREAS